MAGTTCRRRLGCVSGSARASSQTAGVKVLPGSEQRLHARVPLVSAVGPVAACLDRREDHARQVFHALVAELDWRMQAGGRTMVRIQETSVHRVSNERL